MPYHVPFIVRGRVIRDIGSTFEGRRGSVRFTTPDLRRYLPALPLSSPAAMADHHELRFEEVLDYLHALGQELNLDRNPHLQEACELSALTSGLGRVAIRHFYASVSYTHLTLPTNREV